MCPEEVTGGEYTAGESFTLTWPTSGLGKVTLPCPCGDTFSSFLMASRTCDCLGNQAVWNAANISTCETLSIDICFDSMVCMYNDKIIMMASMLLDS